MGKRNKKKLRKIMRAQVERTAVQPSVETIAPDNNSENTIAPKVQEIKKSEDAAETHETKKEIRKILITYSILILVIIAVYLINTKTDIILKSGTWIVDRLNLSI